MEKFLVKAIKAKIRDLEKTQLEKIENMKKEQKIDEIYAQLNKNKEEALEEKRSHGAGSKEASTDLEKIEKELEKVKIAELNIVKKVKREISLTKGYLTEINNIISEKEKAQKENENIEKDIEKLIKYKEEALVEIRNHGEGSKEASADLEKIEVELKNKNAIKEKNKEIIEQADKKIEKFKQRSDIKKILEEKINKDWDAAIKENEEFDKKHNKTELDENKQDNTEGQNKDQGQEKNQDQSGNQGQEQNKKEEQNQDIKNSMIIDISGNKININENDKLFYKAELKNKEEIKEKYALGSYFIGYKKSEKLVDYALISALEKIDDEENSIVNAYLTIIRDGKSQSENVKECLEKINNAVDITYKFDKKDGKLLNGKEKRIARYAKKMGIASLEGISEKSIFEKIMDKLGRNKGRRLLKSKDKTKALGSGSIAQENKKKTIDLINQDREQQGIRSSIKVDNKDNKIEKAAQEQIGKEVQDIMEHEQEEQK